jgi:hypothetical protein
MSSGRIHKVRSYQRRVPVANPEHYCIVAPAQDRRRDIREGVPSEQTEPDGCLILYVVQWFYEGGGLADIALVVRDDDDMELERHYPPGTPFDYLVRLINGVAILDRPTFLQLGLAGYH